MPGQPLRRRHPVRVRSAGDRGRGGLHPRRGGGLRSRDPLPRGYLLAGDLGVPALDGPACTAPPPRVRPVARGRPCLPGRGRSRPARSRADPVDAGPRAGTAAPVSETAADRADPDRQQPRRDDRARDRTTRLGPRDLLGTDRPGAPRPAERSSPGRLRPADHARAEPAVGGADLPGRGGGPGRDGVAGRRRSAGPRRLLDRRRRIRPRRAAALPGTVRRRRRVLRQRGSRTGRRPRRHLPGGGLARARHTRRGARAGCRAERLSQPSWIPGTAHAVRRAPGAGTRDGLRAHTAPVRHPHGNHHVHVATTVPNQPGSAPTGGATP